MRDEKIPRTEPPEPGPLVFQQTVPVRNSYHMRRHETKRTAPGGADADVRRKTQGKATIMNKYVCRICGWIYDPVENGGVEFTDLPEDWTCPVCGVGKEEFDIYEGT